MDIKTQLINEIMTTLKIEAGMFSTGMIEDAIEGITPDRYSDFFNMLMGDEHSYLKPLDRVAKVAKHFKHSKSYELFAEAPTMAKECYERFYTVNAQMTTYSQNNRDAVPNDRDFFVGMDYKGMTDKHGARVFSKRDLYVLDELGGGEWLMNIKFIVNSKEAVSKIESIIKTAIMLKHAKPKHEAISHEVREMLR